jgi:type I restriction enzyme, S subunit
VLPPLGEQRRIVQWLQDATSEVEGALHVASREIDLLREYRTRLIADVVTGKLDVREATSHLPDEPFETETFNEAAAGLDAGETALDEPDLEVDDDVREELSA